MKEKPIIFNTQMVKAILSGKKTQTRRIVKRNLEIETDQHDKNYLYVEDEYGDSHHLMEYCPYEIGQVLWVRETFNATWGDDILYKANGGSAIDAGYSREPKWRPSIHLPRSVARIFIKIFDIRIERIQDISNRDILSEGTYAKTKSENTGDDWGDFQEGFIKLWDSINKKRGYGWDENPFVWVIDFEVIKQEKKENDINS